MVKALIFDFDGTVADTLPFAVNTAIELNRELKLLGEDKIDIEKFRGTTSEDFYGSLGLSKFKLFIYSFKFLRKLNKNIEKLTTFEGLPEVLKTLKEKGIILGIVTTNTHKMVTKFIKDDQIEYFDFIKQCYFLFGKGRKLKSTIRGLKLKKDEVIYIGDETRDIKAARQVGIKVAAVTWGYNVEKILADAKPDYIIRRTEDLLTLVE
ncbi:HAD-IA family hydrolase [Patescibacteria group bacterium]